MYVSGCVYTSEAEQVYVHIECVCLLSKTTYHIHMLVRRTGKDMRR